MTQKILTISGHKQAGKTTCVNFLHGYEMQRNDVVSNFELDDQGRLFVNAIFIDETGKEVEQMGMLDLDNRDERFIHYCSNNIWPFIKSYNFADALKSIAINFFGLSYEQCYGSEENKNSLTDIGVVSFHMTKDASYFTAREFLQFFGTEICREIKPDVWINFCLQRIKEEDSQLAIVGDCRFPDEADATRELGGKIIRLTRKPYKDQHKSETALDDYQNFDAVIDNVKMTIDEQNKAILDVLFDWKWIQSKT